MNSGASRLVDSIEGSSPGADSFSTLSDLFGGRIGGLNGPRKTLAYVLHKLFWSLAYDWSERAVLLSESERYEVVALPILRVAVGLLENESASAEQLAEAATQVVDLEGRLTPRSWS